MASATQMWTSKLGNKYPKQWMLDNDAATQRELKKLRASREESNTSCADCGAPDNSWASVSHGVFICIVCSDVHRSVGTHITKVKGCSGTYLWGPDEMERMRSLGNRRASQLYGSVKVQPTDSKEVKQRYVTKKYSQQPDEKAFATAEEKPRDDSAGCNEALFVDFDSPNAGGVRHCNNVSHVSAPNSQSLVVRRPAAAAAASCMRQTCDNRQLVATKVDIADSFFDDLFGEPAAKESARSTSTCASFRSAASPDAFSDDFFGGLLGEPMLSVGATGKSTPFASNVAQTGAPPADKAQDHSAANSLDDFLKDAMLGW